MSFTLIDFFNGFQSLKAERRFLATTQSTYFAILAKFNLAKYPATLDISTRDLQIDAGLKSVSTAHECRNVLKNNKLIDFKTERGTTVYRLLTEHLSNKNTLLAEQQPNAKRTAEGRLNLPVRGEVEEVKKKENQSIARACEEELETLLEYWENTLRGGRLSFEHQSTLSALLKERGYDWLKAAMREASTANTNTRGLSPKFLFGVITRKTEEQTTLKEKPAPSYTNTAELENIFGLDEEDD